MAGRVLLDATVYLIKGIASEFDDVKGVERAGCVLEQAKRWCSCFPWKGSSVAIRTPARKAFPCSASQFSYTVPDLPCNRSTQVGRGMILPMCQVHDVGEFTWASAASVLVVPHVLVNPQHPNPCETGRVIRCGLGEAA